MKDMNKAAYIMGVKIYWNRSKKFLALSKESYIHKTFERLLMGNCRFIDTPVARDNFNSQYESKNKRGM